MILTPFSSSQKHSKCSWRNWHIFRPNLIDYINLFKVLSNYMSRWKCTGGNSRGGIGLVGGHQFFLWKIFLVSWNFTQMLSTINQSGKHRNHNSGLQLLPFEHWQLPTWKYRFSSSYICVKNDKSSAETTQMCIYTWISNVHISNKYYYHMDWPVISIPLWLYMLLIILIIFHFFLHKHKMFSLFLHILCSKGGGGHLFSSRKQILV